MSKIKWTGWTFLYGMSREHNYRDLPKGTPQYYGDFPTAKDIDKAEMMIMDLDAKRMYIGAETYTQYCYKIKGQIRSQDMFKRDYPTWTPVPDKVRVLLRTEGIKRRSSSKKQANNTEFLNYVTGGVKLDDSMTLLRFLDGATDGGGNLKIHGDILTYWNILILGRGAQPNEYVMGRDVSGGGNNNAACMARTMGVLLRRHDLNLWPSDMHLGSHYNVDMICLNVLQWCYDRMRVAQIKMPTATKKTRPSYQQVHNEALTVYNNTCARWGREVGKYEGITEDIEFMMDIYGDMPKMKEHNAALRMQWEFSQRG